MEETRNQIIDTESKSAPAVKQKLPNSGGILTMGILSIVFAGGIGIILGIIALSLSGGAIGKYNANPELYTESSFKNAKAGKVCAIIGVSLAALVILIVIAANM